MLKKRMQEKSNLVEFDPKESLRVKTPIEKKKEKERTTVVSDGRGKHGIIHRAAWRIQAVRVAVKQNSNPMRLEWFFEVMIQKPPVLTENVAVKYIIDHSFPHLEDDTHQTKKVELFAAIARITSLSHLESYYFPTAKHFMEIADGSWTKLDPPAYLESGYYDPKHYDFYEAKNWETGLKR